jgi:hypothetical protein
MIVPTSADRGHLLRLNATIERIKASIPKDTGYAASQAQFLSTILEKSVKGFGMSERVIRRLVKLGWAEFDTTLGTTDPCVRVVKLEEAFK